MKAPKVKLQTEHQHDIFAGGQLGPRKLDYANQRGIANAVNASKQG